jgi:hypothetical protein
MIKILRVKAAHADRPCPMWPRKVRTVYENETGETRDRTMIYADEVLEVPNIRFYRRRILKGDLIEVRQNPELPPRKVDPMPEPGEDGEP